jgi:hypothetical protein
MERLLVENGDFASKHCCCTPKSDHSNLISRKSSFFWQAFAKKPIFYIDVVFGVKLLQIKL